MINELGYSPTLNYSESYYVLDIVIFVNNVKINIEYDGWYWHRNKQKDDARNSVLFNLGWNIIRVQSGNMMPDPYELDKCIKNAIENNERLQFIKLSDWIKNNENLKEDTEYGKTYDFKNR